MIKGRSFLKLLDFTKDEIQYLIDLSKKLKKDKKNGIEKKTLEGKNIALIFEKTSTRTRCAFEVAAFDQGANVSYIGPSSSQIGDKESMEDTAKVLGRFYDGIEYRGYGQEVVEILSEHSGVPVWNGLTTEFHPTQILADFLTILEKKGKLKGIKLAYVGDGRNNMANSLMIGAAKFGMDFRIVAPKELFPRKELAETAIKIAEKTKGRIFFTDDRIEGVKDADVIYTDVWVSMGETKEVWKERIERLSYYQVNSELVKHAKSDYIFMHCLPAHRGEEISENMLDHKNAVVWDEAENRLHAQKALVEFLINENLK